MKAYLAYDWRHWIARPNQLPPTADWRIWLVMAGRGFGKTRIGAEWVRESAEEFEWVNLIGATADDCRDIMVDGESGILAVCPKWRWPQYRPSLRRLDWPNGAKSLIFTADEPERLRGKQHARVWADELGAWRYPEAWDQAMLGLRLGHDPRIVATTTPKPVRLIRDLIKHPHCVVTHGTTYDNLDNLAPAFAEEIIRKYEGTRLGRQELNAELLEDVEGALWSRALLDEHRLQACPPNLRRVVVAVDPSVSSSEGANEAGIVVCAVNDDDNRGLVLADLSLRDTPSKWAQRAVGAYHQWKADKIVAEKNNGGELVETVMRMVDRFVPVHLVSASRGKIPRAEPVATLYEQGRVSHVGVFPTLEDQMCTWTPEMERRDGESPDRMDALVWGFTDLMVERRGGGQTSYRPTGEAPVTRRGDLILVGDKYRDKS